jgi:hypothetical protein
MDCFSTSSWADGLISTWSFLVANLPDTLIAFGEFCRPQIPSGWTRRELMALLFGQLSLLMASPFCMSTLFMQLRTALTKSFPTDGSMWPLQVLTRLLAYPIALVGLRPPAVQAGLCAADWCALLSSARSKTEVKTGTATIVTAGPTVASTVSRAPGDGQLTHSSELLNSLLRFLRRIITTDEEECCPI